MTEERGTARISLDPPRTVGYRIGEYFIRRSFGELLDPFRAMGHNLPVVQAIGKLEQRVPNWNALDVHLKDLADFAAAVRIGCPWCIDFGYWIMHTHGIPRRRSRRSRTGVTASCSVRWSASSWSTPRR